MRALSTFSPASILPLVLGAAVGCGSVPTDPGARIFPAKGVIRGTVVYQGPRPCSQDGHIVGAAVVLVFDRRNPPPPGGLATTAVNFADVTGDSLFGDEPRFTGGDVYCPAAEGFTDPITASGSFEVAPMDGGSYEVVAFYDSTGNFLPEFPTRNLPERGDVAGGDIDTAEALLPVNVGNPDFQPSFLAVDVGTAQPLAAGSPPGTIPSFVVSDNGFVADNVTVTLAARVPTARPYFYAQGLALTLDAATMSLTGDVVQSSDGPAMDSNGIAGAVETDPYAVPVLTIPQDIEVLAPPTTPSPASAGYYESKLPHLRLPWGVPGAELAHALATPFNWQVSPTDQTPSGAGFLLWQNATLDPTGTVYVPQSIPEGNVPDLWPKVVLTRLPDPGDAFEPLVLLQGITLLGGAASDSLLGSTVAALQGSLMQGGGAAGARPVVAAQDHLTVALRPSVICLPSAPYPGTLVTPRLTATTADVDCSSGMCVPSGIADQPVFPPQALSSPALAALVTGAPVAGCLPLGRYGISVVYPDGQAWTVPNEGGVCSAAEGATDYGGSTCAGEPRPVLSSQGARAVVEIVAGDVSYCSLHPVPAACLAQ